MIISEYIEMLEYKLKVPNKEVQISLNRLFYKYLTGKNFTSDKELVQGLALGNPDILKEKLQNLFHNIAYNNYVKNNISDYEGYYASVVYAYLVRYGSQSYGWRCIE